MKNQETYEKLLASFSSVYGRTPAIVSYAPGRIEVLGNHTDYNEGYVLSAAINYGTFFALAPREDQSVRLYAADLGEETEFQVSAPERSEDKMWSNYVKGCLAGVLARLPAPPAKGFDAMLLGNIPQGAGLSSSAALEICATLAFAQFFGISIPELDLARIGQKAEHEYAGVKCGLLDQASSVFGKQDALVFSDFRHFEFKPVSVPEDVCFLMCNTHAKHALVDGAYNERREACEAGARHFAAVLDHPVTALRDVSWDEWEKEHGEMEERIAKRCAHPIGEDERVLAGIEYLREGDVENFGALMFQSHDSSRNYFENSCPELDTLVDAAKGIPGVLGARLSGGGFGGSVVVLVHKRDAETAAAALSTVYTRHYGKPCGVCVITCSEGAHLVQK